MKFKRMFCTKEIDVHKGGILLINKNWRTQMKNNISIKFLMDKVAKTEGIVNDTDHSKAIIEKITKELLAQYIENYNKFK